MTPAKKVADPTNPFAPQPVVDTQALTAKLAQINRDVQAADRERAAAEQQLATARKDLGEIDNALKAMNVEPDKAEPILAQLEQQLATQAASFEAQILVERQAYQQITQALA